MATVREHLTCSRCSKLMHDPYLMACGHSFCLGCCTKSAQEGVITCHQCLKSTKKNDIQQDRNRKNLVEFYNQQNYGQSKVADVLHLDIPVKYNMTKENKLKQMLEQFMTIDFNKSVKEVEETVLLFENIFHSFTDKLFNVRYDVSQLEPNFCFQSPEIQGLESLERSDSVDSLSTLLTFDSGIDSQHDKTKALPRQIESDSGIDSQHDKTKALPRQIEKLSAHKSVYTDADLRYFRLSALIVNLGTAAARKVFDGDISKRYGGNLLSALNTQDTHRRMEYSQRGRLLNRYQYDTLYPPIPREPRSADFDFTLLMFLFRNLLHYKVPPSTRNWNVDPQSGDLSLSADLVRLRKMNTVYRQMNNTQISEKDFNQKWAEMEQIIVRFDPTSASVIDRLKHDQIVLSEEAKSSPIHYGVMFEEHDLPDPKLRNFDQVDYLSLVESGVALRTIESTYLDYPPSKLHAVGNTLWCTGFRGSLYIYSTDCRLLKVIKLQTNDSIKNIIPDGRGSIIACASGTNAGLHQFDMNGKHTGFIESGLYADVTYHNDMLWVIAETEQLIMNFSFNTEMNKWVENTKIKVDNDEDCSNAAIAVCDDVSGESSLIYICSHWNGDICKYNSSGQLLKQYPSHRSARLHRYGGYSLSGIDPQRNILITGDSLRMCSADGELREIHTDDDHRSPVDAVVDGKGNVWLCTKGKLIKYSIETVNTQSSPPGNETDTTQSETEVIKTTSGSSTYILEEKVKDILKSEEGFLGLYSYEEHQVVIVDLFKDNYNELEQILNAQLSSTDLKHIRLIKQEQRWTPCGDPIDISCEYSILSKGNVAAIAKVTMDNNSDWYAMTCKHVIGSDGPEDDTVNAINIKKSKVSNPKVYSFIGKHGDYFVDVGLVCIGEDMKKKLMKNIWFDDNLQNFCTSGGCNHVKDNTKVEKNATKTKITKSTIDQIKFQSYNLMGKYEGRVCNILSERNDVFNKQGDSGSLVITSARNAHAVGLISCHNTKYSGLDNKMKYVEKHSTMVVYLHSCIDKLQSKYPGLDIEICTKDDFLKLCDD